MKCTELAKKLGITLTTLYMYLGQYNMTKYIVHRGKIVNYDIDCYFKISKMLKRRFEDV